jgi:predicted transcriptional regulator
MTVNELIKLTGLSVYSGENGLHREITGGYTSDLLSDVMGHTRQGMVWITLQTHRNVSAIASLKDLAAVIIVNNNMPEQDMLEGAIQEGIPVLGTSASSFVISGLIFSVLVKK